MAGFADEQRKKARAEVRRLANRLRGAADLGRLKRAGLLVGEDVYVGVGAFLDPDFCFLISIGDRSVLSIDVTVLAHDASTRHSVGWTRIAKVAIGDDVFIGAGAIILPGVKIGNGAVVGAGSVVRHDVPSGAIAAGNPAKILGDVAEYVSLHQDKLNDRPHWPRSGWTAATGITTDRVLEMRAALDLHGEAYIK